MCTPTQSAVTAPESQYLDTVSSLKCPRETQTKYMYIWLNLTSPFLFAANVKKKDYTRTRAVFGVSRIFNVRNFL